MTDQEIQPRSEEKDEQRQALFRFLLVLVAGVFAATAFGIVKALAVIAAVILMIMLHELGHFLTAKWAGMKVTEYFLGFGPRLWSVRKGETEYGVKLFFLLGGYVKIVGMHNLEEVDPEDEPRTYRQKSFPRRLSVAIAGSTVHFILAFLLLWGLNSFVGVVEPDMKVGQISKLENGQSPAEEAGFELGDRIVSVDGKRFAKWDELPPYIKERPGQRIDFVVERDGREVTVSPVAVDRRNVKLKGDRKYTEPVGFVGISPTTKVEKTDPFTGIGRSAKDLGFYTKETIGALGKMVSADGLSAYGRQLTAGRGAVAPSEDDPRFLSPIGLGRLANTVANSGLRSVLFLLVAINVFVGIFNMIPLLPFDGGHVAIAAYERIRSRRGRPYHVDVAKLMPITYMVFLLLMFVAVTSMYLDIVRPLSLE